MRLSTLHLDVFLFLSELLFLFFYTVNELLGEIEVLAYKTAQHGRIRDVQYYFTPMYNSLRKLKGLEEKVLPPLDTFMSNDELLDLTMTEPNQLDVFEITMMLLFEITTAVIFRDMEKAGRIASLVRETERENRKRLLFIHNIIDFFTSITDCYHARQNEGPDTHMIEARGIRDNLEKLIRHSRWNFENKYLLIKAECHYTDGEFDKAAESYEASITAAKQHKFVHEEALGCELAGYFYKEQGNEIKAQQLFKRAKSAYVEWGANAKTLPGIEL